MKAAAEGVSAGRGLGRLSPWILAAVALATRLATAAEHPTEWDSVNLVMGVDRFDLGQGTPHAPGYWLYVAAARAVRSLTPLDAHDSLLLLAALASAATVFFVYLVGRDIGGRWLGLAAGIYLLSSPFLWFYGSVVATYAFDALASVLLIWLAWRARPFSRYGALAAAVLGLGAGFRPTSLILLLPLAVVAAARSVRTIGQALSTLAAGGLALGVWLVPMALEQPGGIEAIRYWNGRTWIETVQRTSIFYGAPLKSGSDSVFNNLGQTTGYTLASLQLLLLLGLLALFFASRKADSPIPVEGRSPDPRRGSTGIGRTDRRRTALTPSLLLWIAILPPIVFLLAFHFGKAGYVLSFLPALVLLLLLPVGRLGRRGLMFASVLLALIAALNLQRFLAGEGVLPRRLVQHGSPWFLQEAYGAPYRMTQRAINLVDDETHDYLEIAKTFNPDRDVLVYVWLNGGHRFRHGMYTFPKFITHLVRKEEGDENIAQNRIMSHEYDRAVEVPSGGQAVFVLDASTPELESLINEGKSKPLTMSSGRTVWLVKPGSHLFTVDIVERAAP